MKQFYFVLASCFMLSTGAFAQQEGTLSTMRALPQSTYTNPAFVPLQTAYVGLPGLSSLGIYANTNSLTYGELEDAGLLDSVSSKGLLAIRSSLKDKNWFAMGAQVDLLSFGFRVNPQLFVRFRANMRLNNREMFPKSLVMLADEAFIESPQNISLAPQVNVMSYLENSFGASYIVDRKLTVGANIKRLNGLAAIHTEKLQLDFQSVPSEGTWEIEGEMLAYTSGEQVTEDDFDFSDQRQLRKMLKGNGGWAVDLGATYQVTPKLQLGLSILDLGYIKWKNGAKEYVTTKTRFSANDPSGDGGDWDVFFETLGEELEPEERRISSFNTKLPARFYLNATYELQSSTHASGIFFTEQYKGRTLPGFTAAIHKEFGRFLGTSLSYTAINGSFKNIGAGLSLRASRAQFYLVSDNITGFSFKKDNNFINRNTNDINVRLGLNLVFGNIKTPTKLPY